MGRTADYLKYQTYRARKPRKMSMGRHATYQRRRYWRLKLIAAGVPEKDLDDMVLRVLRSRYQMRTHEAHPEKRGKAWRSWYYRNRELCSEKVAERYAQRAREERQRLLVSLG